MCNKLSQEDQLFVSKLSKGICFQDGHYVMPLPFKETDPVLPNNKSVALKRVKSLRQRLKRDSTFCQHYSQFMKELISNGHAEMVPESDLNSNKTSCFIPHHGVYHPQKRDKIRVVFDCSATFESESLNAHLLQGPDLTNKLVGVLCRFRKEPVALMCDVEKMFHQFKVCKAHRDYLRFLWWEDDDFERSPTEFRMTVHLFGAIFLNEFGCANFGMKKMASDNEEQFGSDIADFIRHDFYVDDGLRSVVIQSLPSEFRAKDLKNVDLIGDNLLVQRTLGVLWCLDSDTFQYEMVSNNRPLTRRGIVSTVSSIYDPLGFISPVALSGKQILQQMCADQVVGWDDPLPESLNGKWVKWCAGLKNLPLLKFPRCVKPEGFGKIRITEMHHFSDASSYGYGQCSYIRLVNDVGQVHCALLMGKSRVVPLRPITIPRLELTAAVLSVKISSLLDQELEYPNLKHFFWTDSKVVLGYICNEARRFHIFVANRVQQIEERTNPNQWNYVASGENPADLASRGASVAEPAKTPMWLNGPEFLWKQGAISANIGAQFSYFSDWHRCKREVALVLRYKGKLLQKSGKLQTAGVEKRSLHYSSVTVNELLKAETEIFKGVKLYDFKGEIDTLKTHNIVSVSNDRAEQSLRTKSLKGRSNLCSLGPFLDKNGLTRVGGRVQHAEMSDLVKFPVVLHR
ncbi:uncharacterized protein LOC128558291 [Mercenaria mercenaria]|uniref:uncharacterized protein LOC128558291 n=1 Tax=Mercenaria mercenaria TaxID=6596 RepID=UPI00234F43FF|nr:uncharacterized protein LOC128558291 [Mercenaria mercenaria]